jgi:hypothetical protein
VLEKNDFFIEMVVSGQMAVEKEVQDYADWQKQSFRTLTQGIWRIVQTLILDPLRGQNVVVKNFASNFNCDLSLLDFELPTDVEEITTGLLAVLQEIFTELVSVS